MRVLLSGGGTAGHVNPALAIAQTIQRNSPSSEFAYVTTKKGIEKRLVPYKQYEINVTGLKRSFSFSNLSVFAPNVFVFTTFEPALKYSHCMRSITSGCVIFQSSGSSPGRSPAFCRSVPIPPSSTAILSFKNSLISIFFHQNQLFFPMPTIAVTVFAGLTIRLSRSVEPMYLSGESARKISFCKESGRSP